MNENYDWICSHQDLRYVLSSECRQLLRSVHKLQMKIYEMKRFLQTLIKGYETVELMNDTYTIFIYIYFH